MAEDITDNGGDLGAGAVDGGDAGKTFTQADIDRIVSDRLARERSRFADYDDLKSKAAELDEILELSQSEVEKQQREAEKAIKAAREEGFAEAQQKSAESAVMAILRANLQARGKSGEELDELMEPVTASRFIKDGEVNTDKVIAYAAKLAPAASSFPDLGQGRRGSGAKTTDMNQLIRQAAGR